MNARETTLQWVTFVGAQCCVRYEIIDHHYERRQYGCVQRVFMNEVHSTNNKKELHIKREGLMPSNCTSCILIAKET